MSTAPIPNAFDVVDNVLGSHLVTLQFTAGTAGAAPSELDLGNEYVASITKSTNDYILAFRAKYQRLYPVAVHVKQASFAAAGASYGNVSASAPLNSSPTATLSFYKGSDGTAVALAVGDVVTVTLKLSQVKP